MKFQFSIRDLLLIVAIVALAAGWWIDHQRIAKLSGQTWEYRTIHPAQSTAEVDLNKLGADGWEVCGTGQQMNFTVILKRPMK